MNKYLEKIAVSRLVTEIAKGTVKTPISSLVSKGILRSEQTYLKGMKLGNANIAQKNDISISAPRSTFHKIMTGGGGGYTSIITPKDKAKVMVSPIPKAPGMRRMLDTNDRQGMIRHELFEAHDLKRIAKDPKRSFKLDDDSKSILKEHLGSDYSERQLKNHRFIKPDSFSHNNDLVGMHATPRVLSRESEMVRKNPYMNTLRATRDFTGEADIVHNITGKRYGVDKMTSSDHRRAFKASTRAPDSPYPSALRDHTPDTKYRK